MYFLKKSEYKTNLMQLKVKHGRTCFTISWHFILEPLLQCKDVTLQSSQKI